MSNHGFFPQRRQRVEDGAEGKTPKHERAQAGNALADQHFSYLEAFDPTDDLETPADVLLIPDDEDSTHEGEPHRFMRSDVFSQYMWQRQERTFKPSKNGKLRITELIDPIDPELVAGANIRSIEQAHRSNGLGTFSAFQFGFTILSPDGPIPPEILRSPQEAEAERERRGLRKTPNGVLPMVAAALRFLSEKSKLYFGASKEQVAAGGVVGATPAPNQKEPLTSASAFFVKKKEKGMLRVITDARWANYWFRVNHCSFTFFTPECLKSVICNLRAGNPQRTWYAINVDLRHWFHQIPLPSKYLNYLGTKVPGRQPGDYFWYFPRAVSMGWSLSVYAAQCVTWSILLGKTLRGVDPRSYKFDLPDASTLCGRTTPFPWIPLRHGGGIFVLLDNVLIVTAEKHVADAWFDKIKKDCATHHVILKGGDKLEECFHVMKAGGENCFDFLGVDWYHDKLVVQTKDDEKPMSEMLNEGGAWKGTRTDMASYFGKLNWFRRIFSITNYTKEYKPATDAMLDTYRILTPQVHADWHAHFNYNNINHLQALVEHWDFRASKPSCPLTPVKATRINDNDIGFAVTDAATNTSLYAAVTYDYSPTSPTSPEKLNCVKCVGEFGKRIAIGELQAIQLAVQELVEKRNKKLVILGTDNMNCKHWIEGSPAHDEKIREILSNIHSTLTRHQSRLYITYVPTKENFADELSRNEELEITKLQQNHQLLLAARLEALGTWNLAGQTTGGTGTQVKC